MVNTTPEWYFLNLVLTFFAFYLFVFLIAIFGYIFFRILRKVHNTEWNLHFLEIAIISFAIGLSFYIFICFILDIFMYFNFYSAYLSIIIIDFIFVLFLIQRKSLTREKVANFISSIGNRFKKKQKDSIIFISIIGLLIAIQIIIQWRIITQDITLPSRDTWGSIGHLWHLMDKGYLWRDRHSVHYPRGYHFFIVAPVLINPDYRFSYFYFKFASVALFSFYLLIIAVILKKIFKKNYLVLVGLMLTLVSNQLLSRFCILTSTLVPTIMVLISLIIIRSNCPFYLTGFLVQIMYLFNPAIAACYILAWALFVLMKLISKDNRFVTVMVDYAIKPILLLILLIISQIIHTIIVLDLSLNEFLRAFGWFFGTIDLSKNSNFLYLQTIPLNLGFSHILSVLIIFSELLSSFGDFEGRLLALFLIFALVGLFLATNKFFKEKFSDVINFGKIALITLLWYYTAELLFSNSRIIFLMYFWWVKSRGVEGLAAPVIIFCCFILELLIERAKVLTVYLKNKYVGYRNLLKKNGFSKILRIENIVLILLIISLFSTLIIHREISYHLEFEEEHLETMFFIKDNIPEDSIILVHFYDGVGDALHSLLSTYKLYDWEFEENKNDLPGIMLYIEEKDVEYVLLDLETVNSTELFFFTSDLRFENIYENEIHILFEYNSVYW